jgi:hypothetical protein
MAIVTDGLVFHLNANDSEHFSSGGKLWRDMAGQNDATLNGPTHNSSDGSFTFVAANPGNDAPSGMPIPSSATKQTWEVWTDCENISSGNYAYILHNGTVTSVGGSWMSIGVRPGTAGDQYYGCFNGAHSTMDGGASGIVASNGTVRHLVLTWDGTTQKFYVDGSLIASESLSSITQSFDANNLSIGDKVSNYYRPIDGKVYAIRAYNRDLSSSEITQNYNEGANGGSNPTQRTENTITSKNSAAIDTADYKFGGSSIFLDRSSSQWLETGDIAGFGSTDDFTYECWFNYDSITSPQFLFGNRNGSIGNYISVYFDGSTMFGYYHNQTAKISFTAPGTGWHHFAVVRHDGNVKCYIDGTQAGSTYNGANDVINTESFAIGANDYTRNGAHGWEGHIDEIRFSKTARYTSNFTPSTVPFDDDVNTLLLVHADGTDGDTVFYDDNGYRAPSGMVSVSDAVITTSESKFGTRSLLLDGPNNTDQRLQAYDGAKDVDTGDYTLECFVKLNANNITQAVTYIGDHAHYIANTGVMGYYHDSATLGTTTVTTNTWHHVAWVRTNGEVKMYLNGTLQATRTGQTDVLPTTLLTIGSQTNTGQRLNGYIDEYRFSPIARYTSNFTAPTTKFDNDSNTNVLLHFEEGANGTTEIFDDNANTTFFAAVVPPTEAEASISSQFSLSMIPGDADPNFIDVGYIAYDYFEGQGEIKEADATISSSFDTSSNIGKIVQAEIVVSALFTPNFIIGNIVGIEAALSASFDMSTTVSKFSGNEATLSNIVNLSLQGAVTRDYQSSISGVFTQSVTSTKIQQASSTITSNSSLTVTITTTLGINATITSVLSLTANVDEIEKTLLFNRPNDWKYAYKNFLGKQEETFENYYPPLSGNIDFDTTVKKHGTSSVVFDTPLQWDGASYVVALTNQIDGTNNNSYIDEDEEFVLEFWYRRTTGGMSTICSYSDIIKVDSLEYGRALSNDNDTMFNIKEAPAPSGGADKIIRVEFKTDEFQTPVYELDGTTVLSNNTWYHIAFRRIANGTVQLLINNSVEDSISKNARFYDSLSAGQLRIHLYSFVDAGNFYEGEKVYYDSAAFRKGNSEITGYTSAPVGDYDSQQFLSYFDGNWDDTTTFQLNGAANISSNISVTASIGALFDNDADLTSQATVSATATATIGANSNINSEATVTATATRIQQGEANVDSETTVTVTPDVTRDFDATITSQATTSATATRIQQGVIDTDAVATQVTAAGRIGDFFINADLQATLTVDAVVKAGAVIAMDSAFSTLADTTLYKEFDSSVSSVFTQTISETLFKGFEGTQSSEFTTQADAVKTVDVDSTLDIVSSVSATSLPIRNFDASVTSAFSQTLDNSRTRDFDTNSAIESTVIVDGIAGIVAEASITSTTAIVCDNSRIRDNDIDTDSVATQLSVAVKIADFFINADLQATLTSSPVKRTGNSALLESSATIITDGDVTRDAESDMSIATTVDAEGTSNLTGESSLDSEFTTQTDPIKTVDMNATLGGAGTFVVSAVATRNNEIQTSTTATMAIDVARIRDIQSNIDSALTTVINAGKQVDSASTVNTTATISADVRAIQLGLFEYVIPSETREETIVAEVREATVT